MDTNISEKDKRWLFVSDVDDTLLGDERALSDLERELARHHDRIILVLNSSRPCASIRESIHTNPNLPHPDYLIGALGTEIEAFWPERRLEDYSAHLGRSDWDHQAIAQLMEKLGFEPHQAAFQTAFKASYHVPSEDDYTRALAELAAQGLQAKVIYSGGKNLDVIPSNADKGQATQYLRARLNFTQAQVVVAGDSGNDRQLFEHDFKGIVVANADEEMKILKGEQIYHARAAYAKGVLEGLIYWGVLTKPHLD